MSEVNIQTQLELALHLLTQEQHDAWANELKILQLQCSLSDARREIHELKHTEARLKIELKELEQKCHNELCDYPIHPAFEEKSK